MSISQLPKDFDWKLYLNCHPDLKLANVISQEALEKHYIQYGYKEGRVYNPLPKDFQWEFYLNSHPDLIEAGLKTEDEAIKHYLQYGRFEKRIYQLSPKYITVKLFAGLSNQLYSLAAACIIAHNLNRILILPEVYLRSELTDFLYGKKTRCVPFKDAFDVKYFQTQCGITTLENKPDLLTRKIKLNLGCSWNISQICEYFSPYQDVPIMFLEDPYHIVAPTDSLSIKFMINIIKSIRPNDRLYKYVQNTLDKLPKIYNCLHFRYEHDWKVHSLAQSSIMNANEVLKRLPFIISEEQKIYLCGLIDDEQLQIFKNNTLYTFIDKSEVWDAEAMNLSFEEKAIIDFEIAKNCEKFIGCTGSTFSILLCLLKGKDIYYQPHLNEWHKQYKLALLDLSKI